MDSTSRDFIKRLLNPDPTRRLGSGNCNGCVSEKTIKALLAQKELDALNYAPKTPKIPQLPGGGGGGSELGSRQSNESGFFLTENEKDDEQVTLQPLNNTSSMAGEPRKLELISKQSTESLFNLSSLRSLNNSLTAHQVPPNLKYKINLGLEEVKQHKWFISITDWSDVYNRRLRPPFVPDLRHEGDTKHFDIYEPIDSTKDPVALETEINLFSDF